MVARPSTSTTRSSSAVTFGCLAREDRDAICASVELRLIIITNDEEVVLRSREELDEPQLRRVDVLKLIDADVAEARLPAVAEARIGLQRADGADHQVVEGRDRSETDSGA